MYQLSHGTSAIWTMFSVVKDFLWNCFPSLQTRRIKAENFWTRKICPYYTRNRAITCLSLTFHFLFGKVLTTSKAMKSHYSSEESEEYMTHLFSIMVLVLNRIFAIVKINSAVMIVIIRRFRRSPFLVVKIEGWILHSFIIWQNDPWFWMALLRMHRIFIYSINSISSSLLFLVPTIIRIETCFRIMASDTNNFWL